MMATTIDPALAEKLRREFERTKGEAYPVGTIGRRPNRQKVYSARLSTEEAEVQRVAAAKHLPASTLVRSMDAGKLLGGAGPGPRASRDGTLLGTLFESPQIPRSAVNDPCRGETLRDVRRARG
jgi:hypothetical protein